MLIANTEIKISGDVPTGGGGADYTWTSTNKKIEIGGYDVTMSSVWSFDKTTHEIYHAYQDIVKHTLNTIVNDARAEIDAQLFARMAEVEYDTNHNFSLDNYNSHVHAGQDFYSSPNQTTPAQIAYKNAWDDIMKNHNFTLANYNTLVNNFVEGTSYTAGISTATQASSLNGTEIDYLFNADFNGYNLINTYSNNGSTAGNGDFFDPWNIGYGNSSGGGSVNSYFNINYLGIGGV